MRLNFEQTDREYQDFRQKGHVGLGAVIIYVEEIGIYRYVPLGWVHDQASEDVLDWEEELREIVEHGLTRVYSD